MSAQRLFAVAVLAATVLPLAAGGQARAETPEICREGAGAVAMNLYNVAVTRLGDCLALQGLTPRERVEALAKRGEAQVALDDYQAAIADFTHALEISGKDVALMLSLGRAEFYAEDNEAALAAFDRVVARHVDKGRRDPWRILDLEPGVTHAEARRRYMQLVRDNHPDQMIARGLPEEFIKIANDRIAAINDAWEVIEPDLKAATGEADRAPGAG